MSVKVEQPLLSLQYLQVNAHDPDKLRSTITNEAFILNDNAQLRIHESNLQAFNMSFILKIRANTILKCNFEPIVLVVFAQLKLICFRDHDNEILFY